MGWTAYVDESEPVPGVYVLAAAVVSDADQAAVRACLIGLLLPGQRKLHWHAESEPRRRKLISAICGLPALHMVVVRVGPTTERPERRRRRAMERLLYELSAAGVDEVCVEARERRQNQLDRQLFDLLRAHRVTNAGMRMGHRAGPAEPLLWLPDVVAGSVSAAHRGNRTHLDQMTGAVELITVSEGLAT